MCKVDIACYEAIGPGHVEALLGFYTFTGCDKTGRTSGKSKTFWWEEFCKADLESFTKIG